MKRIINDLIGDGFTKREMVLYGIIWPLCLVAACVISEIIIHL